MNSNSLGTLHDICQKRGWSVGLKAGTVKVLGFDTTVITRLEVYDRKIKNREDRLVTGLPVVDGNVDQASSVLIDLI